MKYLRTFRERCDRTSVTVCSHVVDQSVGTAFKLKTSAQRQTLVGGTSSGGAAALQLAGPSLGLALFESHPQLCDCAKLLLIPASPAEVWFNTCTTATDASYFYLLGLQIRGFISRAMAWSGGYGQPNRGW